jgi:hypothetical protein
MMGIGRTLRFSAAWSCAYMIAYREGLVSASLHGIRSPLDMIFGSDRITGKGVKMGQNQARIALRILFISALTIASGVSGIPPTNPQQITVDVSVVNIEVPVRVYDGDRFVDHLNIEDFEVLENGLPQKIEAVYLVRKTDVVRSSGTTPVVANITTRIPEYRLASDDSIKRRVFLLYFEMDEYPPQTGKAIDYLFENVVVQGDQLLIVTPREQWKITVDAEAMTRRGELAKAMKSRLEKSLRLSGFNVRIWIRNLRDLENFEEDVDYSLKLMRASEIMDQLVAYKSMSEKRFDEFARFLKPITGQKHVFLFYQEESLAIPTRYVDLFERKALERRNNIDKTTIRTLFADADTTIHFLFLRKPKTADIDVESMKEGSVSDVEMNGDFFQTFRDLAVTTGGVVETTFNPVYAMKRVTGAAESYYLLYYKPTASPTDKSFKEITVKVKSGNYRVIHRAGYIDR